MPRFSRLTPQTAGGASRELLGELVERHGTVGDMVATMAHSPAVLGGYLHLSRALRRAKLDRRTSELISIAVRAQQDCGMCLASHVEAGALARRPGGGDPVAHDGTSSDPAVAAIIGLGLRVYGTPASITDEQVDELRALGYSDPRDRRRRRSGLAQHHHRSVQPRRRAHARRGRLTPPRRLG